MATKKSTTRFLLAALAVAALPAVRAYAEGPDGIRVGSARLSPFLNVSYLYDSNPNNANEGRKDEVEEANAAIQGKRLGIEHASAYTIETGINLTLPGNSWKLVGTACFYLDKYIDGSQDDHKDWSESLVFSGETDGGLRYKASESVRKAQYSEKYREFTEESADLLQLIDELGDQDSDRLYQRYAFSMAKSLTEKSDVEISGTFSDTDYEDDALYDYHSYGGTLGFTYKITEKSDAFIRGTYIIHEEDENDPGVESSSAPEDQYADTKSKSMRGVVGLRSRATEKVVYDIGVGLQSYEDFEDPEGGSDTQTSFYYDAGITWKATPRLTFSLVGDSSFQPAEDVGCNSKQSYSVGVNANYRPFERWKFTAGVAYRTDDYTRRLSLDEADNYYTDDEGREARDRKDDGCSLFARAVYGLGDYASLFGSAQYTDVSSSIDDYDYDRYRLSVGLALRY